MEKFSSCSEVCPIHSDTARRIDSIEKELEGYRELVTDVAVIKSVVLTDLKPKIDAIYLNGKAAVVVPRSSSSSEGEKPPGVPLNYVVELIRLLFVFAAAVVGAKIGGV